MKMAKVSCIKDTSYAVRLIASLAVILVMRIWLKETGEMLTIGVCM